MMFVHKRYRVSGFGVILISAALQACGVSTAPNTPQNQTGAIPDRGELSLHADRLNARDWELITKKQLLAQQVTAVLHAATAMRLRSEVTAKPYHILVFSEMEANRFRTRVYAPNSEDQFDLQDRSLAAEMIMRDGRISEWGSTIVDRDGSVHRQMHTYQSPDPDGSGSLYFRSDIGCLFGTNLNTWVGQSSSRPERFEERILNAESITERVIDGVPCIVATHVIQDRDDQGITWTRTDEYAFNASTHLIHDWTTTEVETPSNTTTVRRRRYVIEVLDKPFDDSIFEWSPGH